MKKESVFIDSYINANLELDLLREYFRFTSKSLIKNRLNIESEYKIGNQLYKDIGKLITKDNTINYSKYDKIKNQLIFDNIKFSDIISNINSDENMIYFKINDKYKNNKYFNPNIAHRKCIEATEYESIFFRSIISDIVVTFESLLAEIYRILILNNPFPYLKDEKVPLANFFLKDFSKILLDKISLYVENKMYNSLEVLYEIIQNEKLDIDKDIVNEFKEIYFRRNILIHNHAEINKKYLDSVDQKYCKNLKIGQRIVSDDIYIRKALDCIYILFFYIFYGLLKKYDTREEYMSKVEEFLFRKLQNQEYNITKHIYKKLSIDKNLPFIEKATYKINYLNSIKQLKELDLLNEELKNLDLSIATDNFKIAKLCLEDKNKEIYNQLTVSYPQSFSAIQIKEWPLFVNFRESQEYIKFCSEHADDFDEEKLIDSNEE